MATTRTTKEDVDSPEATNTATTDGNTTRSATTDNDSNTDNNERSARGPGRGPKCSKCKTRYAHGVCTQSACLPCCSNLQCEGHKKSREVAAWKEAVLKGTTKEQLAAAKKRASAVRPGIFRESGFSYMGETITIWSFKDYMKVPKWRDDAIRRSERRRGGRLMDNQSHRPGKRIGNGRKRFRSVMEDLYQKSLAETETRTAPAHA